MSTIRDVSPTGEIVTETHRDVNVSQKNISAPVTPELRLKAVQDAMGLETESDKVKYRDKVETLLEYVGSKKGLDLEGIKSTLRDLELEIGSPPLSERRVSYVARYAYLKLSSMEHQEQSIALAKEAERMKDNE
jgi:hypothetical protein